jgi:hypothetical protein
MSMGVGSIANFDFCQHPPLRFATFNILLQHVSSKKQNIKKTGFLSFFFPHADILSKFMQSCSKLEELHIGQQSEQQSFNIFPVEEPVQDAYRSISKQTHLRKLTLSGLEFTSGSFLQQVRLLFLYGLSSSYSNCHGNLVFIIQMRRCWAAAKSWKASTSPVNLRKATVSFPIY